MGLFSELKLAVPWGHIAAKVWGSQQGLPVLCLHGWLDNANSFDRLIPLLPKDFQYVAMDFGGHGLSSHYSPGFPYYQQNFVSEIRRVTAALKWNRFSLMGHSFGGIVGGTVSGRPCSDHLWPLGCSSSFPVSSLKWWINLSCWTHPPLTLDTKEISNLLTYKRKAIEHMLQVEASKKPRQVVGPEEMLQGLLKNNHHVGEECGKLLLQRGATQEAAGLVLNRDRRITWPQHCLEFISRELFVHAIRKLQARVLLIKATQGYYDVRRENDADRDFILFLNGMLTSVLKERFQFVEVPGNHYIHMNQPQLVAGLISSFLQSREKTPDQPEPQA